MAKSERALDFWENDFTRTLPARGKLALMYVLGCEHDDIPVIDEDMSLATGLVISECQDWVDIFESKGVYQGIKS